MPHACPPDPTLGSDAPSLQLPIVALAADRRATYIPATLARSLVLINLRRLLPDHQLYLNDDTYVIRQGDRYVAYRTWMSWVPLIEVFNPGEESELIQWFERFGFAFDAL